MCEKWITAVPEQLLDQLDQWKALLVCWLIDASVDKVFVQCGATAMQRGGTGFLLINFLLFLCLFFSFDILKDTQRK